ncbi:DNA polymerase III subunit chi [Acetobacteraceae bacterium KSS8]|uniref:DNA polymerase III subunit chi n=1 Tax=Endosaccharibacter trunci TaxID=2812733 RepID=A0ABT1W798_9PROT|nr:DNA polymerase III subunit chi [Acetobacteraceae bacterium KSS8]
MTEIGFYHLTRTTAEDALPALLGRTLQAGKRAVVRCRDAERVAALDAALWRAPEPVWLPHGTAAGGDADLQPVWITADDAVPNGATFLFLLDGAAQPEGGSFERVFDLFDGNDPSAVAEARLRWTAARTAGATLAYWRQEPKGWTRAG